MRDFLELTKPRITILIPICTAVGYFFGRRNLFHLSVLVHVLLGTALMALGVSAQPMVRGRLGWQNAQTEAAHCRQRMNRIHGCAFGVFLSAAGFTELWYGTNALTTALGLFRRLTC